VTSNENTLKWVDDTCILLHRKASVQHISPLSVRDIDGVTLAPVSLGVTVGVKLAAQAHGH
jgi:hypothetical protein